MKTYMIIPATIVALLVTGIACDRDSFPGDVMQADKSVGGFNADDFEHVVDTMPEIIGGLRAIVENITYPETAKNDGVGGVVYLFAYIDAQGDVAHVDIAKGVRDDLDQAAIEAVKPVKFKPGMRDGEPVGVRVSIPIHFRLTSATE